MFIHYLMKKLWENESRQYNKVLNDSLNKNIIDLYNETIFEIINLKRKYFKTNEYTEVVLESMGCTYCNKNGYFCGCSMCDWDSLLINLMARMEALRRKNIDYYCRVVAFSITNIRGVNIKGDVVEEIAIHNSFCSWQFPDELIDFIFHSKNIYIKNPSVGILQARAESITQNRILKWKTVFKKKLSVSIGVETIDEWLRNHWLNKSIKNSQINDALILLKENDCNTNVNILFGLPGFNERQTIEEFKYTIGKLYINENIDTITISPLVTRRNTLQNIINKNGLIINKINLKTFFIGLIEILDCFPGIENKIVISPPNFMSFVEENYDYKKDELSNEIYKILKEYIRIGKNVRWKDLLECSILKNQFLTEYQKKIMSQSSYDELKKDLYSIVDTLSQTIFKENESKMKNMFLEELKDYKD